MLPEECDDEQIQKIEEKQEKTEIRYGKGTDIQADSKKSGD